MQISLRLVALLAVGVRGGKKWADWKPDQKKALADVEKLKFTGAWKEFRHKEGPRQCAKDGKRFDHGSGKIKDMIEYGGKDEFDERSKGYKPKGIKKFADHVKKCTKVCWDKKECDAIEFNLWEFGGLWPYCYFYREKHGVNGVVDDMKHYAGFEQMLNAACLKRKPPTTTTTLPPDGAAGTVLGALAAMMAIMWL